MMLIIDIDTENGGMQMNNEFYIIVHLHHLLLIIIIHIYYSGLNDAHH